MFPVTITARQLHNRQKEEGPGTYPAFSESDRGTSTFTRKINRISGFKNSKLPPEPWKLRLFSRHFFSGTPGRKGQGRRQMVTRSTAPTRAPTPRLKSPRRGKRVGAFDAQASPEEERCGGKDLPAPLCRRIRVTVYKTQEELRGSRLLRCVGRTSSSQGSPHPQPSPRARWDTQAACWRAGPRLRRAC